MTVKHAKNAPCICGSGQKYKKCCGTAHETAEQSTAAPAPRSTGGHAPPADAPSPAVLSQLVILMNAGRFGDLENGASELVARHPNSGVAWKILGLSLWQQGKDPVPALEAAAKYLPDDAEAHSNLGNALRRARRPEEAMEAHRRALAITPHYPEAHNNLGSALQDLGRLDEACASYRRATELNPEFAMAHANLGGALWESGQPEAAVASYLRALQIKPDFLGALVPLAGALRDLGQAEAAEARFREALRLQPGSAELHHNLAVVLKLQSRTVEANASSRRALELNPQLVAAIVFAAKSCGERGEFAQAETLINRAIGIDPGSAEAWSAIPKLRKMTRQDTGWLESAQRAADRLAAPRQEVHLRYAIGKYFDDVGDFSQAFANFRHANELTKRFRPPHDQDQLARFIERICRHYDRSWLSRTRPDSSTSDRPVFIVGMPRSGTTLAEQILASHPAVFGAGELPFWAMQLTGAMSSDDAATNEFDSRSLADGYLRLLETLSADALRVVDKMPTNFLSVGLIHSVLPHARFIHMRRNPIDTCLSIYFQDFETAYSYSNDLDDLAHCYSEYHGMMSHWRSALPEGAILQVPYEGLVQDLELWSRRMVEFLALPWDSACLRFHQTSRTVTSASSWQVRQAMHATSVERWRNYEPFIEPLMRLAALEESATASR